MTKRAPDLSGESLLSRPATRIAWKWWAAWLVGFGVFSMMIPRDASYDVVHYHLHNGWSAVNGRSATDLAPAEMHSFLNPAWQVFIWRLIDLLPGRLVAFLLGMLQGLILPALYALSRRLLVKSAAQPAQVTVLAIAVAGFLAEAQFGLFGSIRNDALCALAFLTSLVLLIPEDRPAPNPGAIVLGSFLIGAIVGIKPTNIVYAAGFAVAVLVILPDWPSRLKGAAAAGAAGLFGIVIFAGPWAWHLYQTFGNPIFPMMNTVFEAPLGPDIAFRDEKFLPGSFLEGIVRPFLFLFDGELIHEYDYFDPRFVLTYLGAFSLVALVWIRRDVLPAALGRPVLALAASLLAVIAVWTAMFSIGRYVAALWMLGPVIAATVLAVWRPQLFHRRYTPHVALAACALLFVSTQPAELRRAGWQSWTEPYVSVAVVSPETYNGATIIFSGEQPSAALAIGFPSSAVFTHAAPASWSAPALEQYRPLIREHWQASADRLFVVILDADTHFPETVSRLETLEGLVADTGLCDPIRTSFDAPAARWLICPVHLAN